MSDAENIPSTQDDGPGAGPPLVSPPRASRWGLLVAAMVVVSLIDRSPSDIANQVTLLALLAVAFAVGRWFRPRTVVAAVLAGSTIAISRALGLLLGVENADPSAPRTWGQVAALLVLVVPALVAAGIGALSRGRSRRRSRP